MTARIYRPAPNAMQSGKGKSNDWVLVHEQASARGKPLTVLVAIGTGALVALFGWIKPDLERWMYERAGSTVSEVASSHVAYISHPAEVAAVIERAAR